MSKITRAIFSVFSIIPQFRKKLETEEIRDKCMKKLENYIDKVNSFKENIQALQENIVSANIMRAKVVDLKKSSPVKKGEIEEHEKLLKNIASGFSRLKQKLLKEAEDLQINFAKISKDILNELAKIGAKEYSEISFIASTVSERLQDQIREISYLE